MSMIHRLARSRAFAGLIVAAYCGVGCGGSAVGAPPDAAPPDATADAFPLDAASSDGSSSDTSPDAPTPGDGGCITPTVGAPCTPGQNACQPSNPCCAGYVWSCSSGVWVQEGLGCACAGSFGCGSLTCTATQYCTDTPPGVAPAEGGRFPDFYQCVTIPSACVSVPTCACIEGTIPAQTACSTQSPTLAQCVEDDAGYVTIHCVGQ
jgi:hypothetical protein